MIYPFKHKVPSGEQYGQAVTTTASIIRYPASNWIVITGYLVVVTNSITNYYPQSVTNFAYTYDQDEIITNTIYKYDGSTVNLTGTNGQIVSIIYTQELIGGFTEWDMGYRPITQMLSKLSLIIKSSSWDTNGIIERYTWQSHSPCESSVQSPVSSGLGLFNEDSYSGWGYSITTNGTGLSYNKGVGWSPYYCPDGYGGYYRFFSFGSSHLYSENRMLHVSETNIPSELFIGYDANFYISQHYTDYWTNKIYYAYSTSNCNAWVTNRLSTNFYPSSEFVEFDAVYRISSYNGIIKSESIASANYSTSSIANIEGTSLTLVSDDGINGKSLIRATKWTEDEYMEFQSTLDAQIYENTKSYLNAGEFEKMTKFSLNLTWAPIVIRNYAVTNGFKYY